MEAVKFMESNEKVQDLSYLLTREQASRFLGIDPKSIDKCIQLHRELDLFMIVRQVDRYLAIYNHDSMTSYNNHTCMLSILKYMLKGEVTLIW